MHRLGIHRKKKKLGHWPPALGRGELETSTVPLLVPEKAKQDHNLLMRSGFKRSVTLASNALYVRISHSSSI